MRILCSAPAGGSDLTCPFRWSQTDHFSPCVGKKKKHLGDEQTKLCIQHLFSRMLKKKGYWWGQKEKSKLVRSIMYPSEGWTMSSPESLWLFVTWPAVCLNSLCPNTEQTKLDEMFHSLSELLPGVFSLIILCCFPRNTTRFSVCSSN